MKVKVERVKADMLISGNSPFSLKYSLLLLLQFYFTDITFI